MAKLQLRRVLTNPERMADFKNANIAAFNDTFGELSRRHTSSSAAKEDQERRVGGRESAGLTPAAALQPSANMSKSVGRNDPCPCGSGKKFKKCCLQ